ncbi:MAG: VCBS repeat-containing protein [Myxococcales bacterium]|nr:VCBS repeat-containing protein [Myxococcales bacterium]
MAFSWWKGAAVVAGVGAVALFSSCSGSSSTTPVPDPTPAPAPTPEPPAPAARAGGEAPLPTLVMVQSQFVKRGGKKKPGAAKMTLLRTDGKQWFTEVVEDPQSNVFHKAMPWRDGILTIGAMAAVVEHWKRVDGEWKATKIYEKSWGGQFDRFRDVEVGDVDGDGKEEMVLATHDMGVVAVGDENADGTWTFQEFDQTPDTFVHEVEIGDVDGDGKKEFYVTPSERNKASGASQPGGVARYDFKDGKYVRTMVVQWEESHAKEILVADMDGDGKDELYAAKEGHVVKNAEGKPELKDPAKIVRFDQKGGKWVESVAATLADEKQCRFLVASDVDGDGQKEMIAAGMDTGLWSLEPKGGNTFEPKLIEADSGGFEHATHVGDLDGDGKPEVYAASEKTGGTRMLRKYTWDGAAWKREDVAPIEPDHITWNLQSGTF